ncbi:MAG: 1-acyl-sn-glycerol-3-phosphate acyltransferase [Leptospiraceae bacterium]|nr:1-acyl-sn-glycerol-3-phosphate acyltransferase [Leptospiraceae bacterium]NUM42342.1 1-acyl-sn-glycerol-3-phosphate acyltransferase [Leptospiraceae bacterium]
MGFFLLWFIVKPLRQIYGNKKCIYINTQILHDLKNQSFIVVSNHIKPRRGKLVRALSMPYDAYILRKMFLKFGIKVTALTSYDSLGIAKTKKAKWIQNKIKAPITKGIIRSIDLIPVNRKENDKETIQDMKTKIKQNYWIGIFPEGTWFRGFRKSRKLHSGMAVLSKRYNLPILPVYIDAYNLNKKPEIRIGKPILSSESNYSIVESVRTQLNLLKLQQI